MAPPKMFSRFTSLLFISLLTLGFSPSASAQNLRPSTDCEAPPELELLNSQADLTATGIISAYSSEQINLDYPNLWWAKEQFDIFGGRLIRDWFIYPEQKRIDLIVNRQLWSVLRYLDHYRLTNQFGTVARTYGYNLRIFNQRQQCLGIYSCDFTESPNQCEIDVKPSGSGGFSL